MRENIVLIDATLSDSKVLWEWRNHPEIRKCFFNSEEVSWKEHEAWFSRKLGDSKTKIYVAGLKKDKIGVIRFEDKGKEIIVSVNLNPAFFYKGLGRAIIKKGTERFLAETKAEKSIIARIKRENAASRKAFIYAGYKVTGICGNEAVFEYKKE